MNKEKNIFKNKNIIVTGCGKGFGLSLAKQLIKMEANLALITRSITDLKKLQSISKKISINKSFDQHIFFCGDASNEEDVKKFFIEIKKRFKRIDGLVNNAGMRFRKKFLKISNEEWNEVHQNNLNSVFLMSKNTLQIMQKQRKGKIVNISSIVGISGFDELSAYASSKSAINGLTKSLAREFAKLNININAIAPGFCKTSYYDDFKKNQKLYKFTLDNTPLGRWGEEEDVVNLILFLLSNNSDYITGEIIKIDGGWTS